MAKLIIYKNQSVLMTLNLDPAKEYIAGRSSDCDILLDDVIFSRQHFKIFFAQGKWTVQSISKYSQLAINFRESDYFTLKHEDKFSTFTYEFHFMDSKGTGSRPITPDAVEDKTVYVKKKPDMDENTRDIPMDDKTFVPQMTSQEWSIGVPYILLRKEDGSTLTMRLEGEYWIIGRDESCDITIEDPKASREHCEIFQRKKQFYIMDKESSNGTIVNYKKISPGEPVHLRSGDQIQIGKFVLIFEIRDPLFAEKLSSLPADVNYDSQHMDYAEMDLKSSKKVIKISKFEKNKKKYITIGGSIIIIMFMYLLSGEPPPENKELSSKENGPVTIQQLDALSPEQRDLIEKSYNLAKTLYTQGKYELALTEVEKIHNLISEYKDSKEIAQYSQNAIDTLMEQKDIERSEKEQQALFAKVEGIVEQCGISYSGHRNTERLQECLAPALELDPENAKAAQLMEVATQEDLKRDQMIEQRAFYNSQVAQRKKIFSQAETLKKQGKTLDALTAYSRHVASTLPDPDGLADKSRAEVKNLQQKISDDVERLKSAASSSYDKKDYKDAISKLEQALRLDPQNFDVKDAHSSYSKELQGIVKNLYGDAILKENFGDIDAAKDLWKKIRSIDVPHGEYYKKSGIKLKKYGS